MSDFVFPWSRRITPVLQAEVAECGLACLTMVANAHGHKVNLPGLRAAYFTSIKGATLAELMAVANDLDLGPRPLRLEIDELDQLRLPAILHWNLDHFVVLESLSRGRATILDPAMGRREMGMEAVSRHFTGVALECQPTQGLTPKRHEVRVRIADLWSGMQGYARATAQVLGLSLILQLTALALPYFMQLTIDEAVTQGDANLMVMLALGFGALYVFSAVVGWLRSWVVLTLGESIAFQLANNVVHHLVRLPLAYFERRQVGDLLSRIGSVRPVQDLITQGLANVAIDTLLGITTFAMMAMISLPLTLLVAGTTALYFGISLALFPQWRQRFEEQILARAAEETYLLETMRAIRSIKLFGAESQREAGWRNKNAEVITAGFRSSMFAIRTGLAEHLLFSLQMVAIVYIGAVSVIGEKMSLGVLLAFLAYRGSFTDSAAKVVQQVQQWRMVGLHLDRLSDIVAEKPEQIGVAPARAGANQPAEIRIEGLTYAYSASEKPVLDRIDLTIPAGGFVAIVGPSGAGKTTLVRLMLGLLPPSAGQIAIDGVPLGAATLAAWRARVGAVLQDDLLLTGTLADNIAFFDTSPDQPRVEACARAARVHDEIMAMPMGYSSLIGDMGSALSSGQRQRILLARALYRQPDALFLDEGTANLDEANENAIADTIAAMGITRIVIAHRPALIERADAVVEVSRAGMRLISGTLAGMAAPMPEAEPAPAAPEPTPAPAEPEQPAHVPTPAAWFIPPLPVLDAKPLPASRAVRAIIARRENQSRREAG